MTKTNNKDEYVRNFLRNTVFPVLKKRFPKCDKTIIRQAEIFAQANKYIEIQAQKFLKANSIKQKNERKIQKKLFLDLPIFLQMEVIRQVDSTLSFLQVQDLCHSVATLQNGKKINIHTNKYTIGAEYFFIES